MLIDVEYDPMSFALVPVAYLASLSLMKAPCFKGVALSTGVAATGLSCLLGDPSSLPVFIDSFKNAAPILVPVAKVDERRSAVDPSHSPSWQILVAFPFVFHMTNGFRHIFWDATARGLDLKVRFVCSCCMLFFSHHCCCMQSLQMSSYAVVGVAGVVTLGLGFTSFD